VFVRVASANRQLARVPGGVRLRHTTVFRLPPVTQLSSASLPPPAQPEVVGRQVYDKPDLSPTV
jgi:hypothetical protein